MDYAALEKLIEEIVLRSFGEYVDCLPPRERAIFSLYLEGCTASEISETLKGRATIGFVNKTIQKVKQQLKDKYDREVAAHCV